MSGIAVDFIVTYAYMFKIWVIYIYFTDKSFKIAIMISWTCLNF